MQVRWFAGAADAAGVTEEDVEALDGTSVVAALSRHRPQAAAVLQRCSFLADGRPVRAGDPVPEAATLDVLPPFAGG